MSYIYNWFGEWSSQDNDTEIEETQNNNTAGLTREDNSEKNTDIENKYDIIEDGVGASGGLGAASMLIGNLSDNDQTSILHLNSDDDNKTGDHGSNIKTLEDSLRYFKLEDTLQLLEESLERVRRHRKNKEAMEVHNSILRRLDKLKIPIIHPDKVEGKKSSEEELLRTQKLQTALNATRKAINILNKIFLEDIDIYHKYGFYTKLDISSLENEDKVEDHVLFKISLMSEIKQCHIIAEIGKFLAESQCCIASYVQGNGQYFEKHMNCAVFHLKQCIRGYKKLLRDFKEIQKECKAENLDNICSLIRSMKHNCSRQLNHLELLWSMIDLCSNGSFGIFSCPEELDDYFVCPFVFYINIILMCYAFKKSDNKSNSEEKVKCIPNPAFNKQTVFLASSYYLTSYYLGSKINKHWVQEYFKQKTINKISVKEEFLAILSKILYELKDKFKIDEYSTSGGRRYIAEELKKCKEMKSELKQKKDLAKEKANVKKNTQKVNKQIDNVIKNQEECRKQCEVHLVENSDLLEQFDPIYMNSKGQQFDKMKVLSEECLNKNSEIQLGFAENVHLVNLQPRYPQIGKNKEVVQHTACAGSCEVNNPDSQVKSTSTSKKLGIWNQQTDKLSDQNTTSNTNHFQLKPLILQRMPKAKFQGKSLEEFRQHKSCSANPFELQVNFESTSGNAEIGNQQMKKRMTENKHFL